MFGLLSSIVTARYLGPEGNGIIASLMVYPSLFMNIGSLGIRQSTTYFVGQGKYGVNEVYGAVLSIWTLTSVFSLVSCYVLIQYFTSGSYSVLLIILAIAAIPFSLYTTYSSGIFLGQQKIKEFNRINWIPAAINLIITFLLIGIFPFGVTGSMIGTFSGVFILSFFVLKKMANLGSIRLNFDAKIMKEMVSLGIVYAVSLLVINLNYKVDIIILEKLSTAHAVGIYSKGVGIVNYLWQIPMLLSTLVFSRSAGSKDPKGFSIKVARLLRLSGIAVLVASIILYFLSDMLIVKMYGEDFKESSMVLKLLLPGVFLLTIYKVLNMDLAGKGKPWLSMFAMIPALILNVSLNYLWVPVYGANGAALASTLSYIFAALVFLMVYSKAAGLPISKILKFDQGDKTIFVALINKIRKRENIKIQ